MSLTNVVRISLGFQKPNGLKYNQLIEEYGISLSTEAEIMSDFALLQLVRAHHLEEKIREYFITTRVQESNATQLQAEAQLQLFHAEIEEWRTCSLNEVKAMIHIALSDRFLGITLYCYDLGLFRPSGNPSSRYLNPKNLVKCLDGCRRFFEYLLSVPVNSYMAFTNVQWGYMVQAIVILSRLSFPIPACPGWDTRAARERAPLAMYLDCLCYRMQGLTTVRPDDIEFPQNPDGPFLFKLVLESIAKKYNERIEALDRLALKDAEGNGTGICGDDRSSCRREQCPIRDPELAHIFQGDMLSSVQSPWSSSDSGTSNASSQPIYFDLWKTMTMSWGE
jgi:hypothetical protein